MSDSATAFLDLSPAIVEQEHVGYAIAGQRHGGGVIGEVTGGSRPKGQSEVARRADLLA